MAEKTASLGSRESNSPSNKGSGLKKSNSIRKTNKLSSFEGSSDDKMDRIVRESSSITKLDLKTHQTVIGGSYSVSYPTHSSRIYNHVGYQSPNVLSPRGFHR